MKRLPQGFIVSIFLFMGFEMFFNAGMLQQVAASEMPRYDIANLTSQTARSGVALEFLIHWGDDPGVVFTCRTDPPGPSGTYGIEPYSGSDWRFFFTPDPENDKAAFWVEVTGESNGEVITKTFEITPMTDLIPEHRVFGIEEDHTLPQEPILAVDEDSHYKITSTPIMEFCFKYNNNPVIPVNDVESTCDYPSMTNHRRGTLFDFNEENSLYTFSLFSYDIRIVGRQVEFKAGSHPFDTYDYGASGRRDIRKMEIIAERVIIHDAFRLPQTEVTIYAKELIFVGEDAKIITTPLSYEEAGIGRATPDATAQQVYPEDYSDPAKRGFRNPDSGSSAGDGAQGLDAGSISAYFENFYSLDGDGDHLDVTRFDLKGGDGQDPGVGVDGVDSVYQLESGGRVVYRTELHGIEYAYWAEDFGPDYRIVYVREMVFGTPTDKYGSNEMPIDGTHAKPSGIPGKGGNGGILKRNFNLDEYADFGYGDPGEQGPTFEGGDASNPAKGVAIQYTSDLFSIWWNVLRSRATSAGNDAVSPGASGSGSDGSIESVDTPYAWLHPLLAGWALNAIKDDYLSNRVDLAESRLKEYVAAMDEYQVHSSWEEIEEGDQYELLQIYDEMQILLQQIESNLDYFGNPAGWVPMLSFESYMVNFGNEIDRAVNMLYLSYWIKKRSESSAKKKAALEDLRNMLRQELEDARTAIGNQEDEVEDLKDKSDLLKDEILLKRQEIQSLEFQLLQEAKDGLRDPEWLLCTRAGLKGAAMAFSIFPVCQPELGTIGDGIRTISNMDPDKPWDIILEAPNVATQFLDSGFDLALEGAALAAGSINVAEVTKDAVGGLKESSQGLTKSLSDMREFYSSIEAPKEEVDALLEKLKSQSPEFKTLVEEIKVLIEKSAGTAREIVDKMCEINRLSNLITVAILEIDALNRDSSTMVLLDQSALRYLNNLERRTHDRLIKYHYYMAKAYEYRLLRPYTGQLDLSDLMEKFIAVAEENASNEGEEHILSGTQFEYLKGIYRNTLSSVADEINDEYTNYHAQAERQSEVTIELTTEELEKLNNLETVVINPVNRAHLHADRENIRIYDLEVTSIKTEPGDYSDGDTVYIKCEHPGLSRIFIDGDTYLFKHNGQSASSSVNPDSKGQAQPIYWAADYQPRDEKLTNTRVSPHTVSLLTTVLGYVHDDIELFSRPAAWADLTVTKTRNVNKPFHLTKIKFMLTYDYQLRDAGCMDKVIIVLVSEGKENLDLPGGIINSQAGFKPAFTVSRADNNSRQNARGSFIRVYPQSYLETVSITAPKRYGSWWFNKWTDMEGNDLDGGPFTDNAIDIPLLPPSPSNPAEQIVKIISAQYIQAGLFFDHDKDGDLDGEDLGMLSDTLTDDMDGAYRLKEFAANFGYRSSASAQETAPIR